MFQRNWIWLSTVSQAEASCKQLWALTTSIFLYSHTQSKSQKASWFFLENQPTPAPQYEELNKKCILEFALNTFLKEIGRRNSIASVLFKIKLEERKTQKYFHNYNITGGMWQTKKWISTFWWHFNYTWWESHDVPCSNTKYEAHHIQFSNLYALNRS